MSQCEKVESEVEIKCNADKFFDVWGMNVMECSKMCPQLHNIELVQGHNCHTPGAILRWTFITPIGGKEECVKSKLEEVDKEKRSITYSMIEGKMMEKYYNTMKEKIEVIPKGDNCSIVKWSVIECHKKCDEAPNPKIYADLSLECVRDVARHISSA